VAYILFLASIFLYFRQIKAHWLVVLCILPAIVFYLELRVMVRPELFSYTLIVIAMLLYNRAREEFSPRSLLPILALLVLWVNYHTPVFGYVIFFGLFFEKALDKLLKTNNSYSWGFLLGWGMLVFLSGFVNPYGSHFIFNQLGFSQEWHSLIREYFGAIEIYRMESMVYILWVIALITVSLLLRAKQYGMALVCIIVTITAWKYARIITPAAVIVLLALATSLSGEKILSAVKSMRMSAKYLGVMIVVLFSGLTLYSNSKFVIRTINTNHLTHVLYPSDVVEYLKKNGRGGKIFNEYRLGGYLAYELSPDYKVYIDGRTNILYPVEFYKKYRSALKSSEILKKEIEKYGIDYAILKTSRDKLHLAEKTGILKTDFVTSNFSLFSKRDPKFPISGRLMHLPMCWKENYGAEINKEITNINILPDNSPLVPVLEFFDEYYSANNKEKFFDDLINTEMPSDYVKRLFAYIALNEGYHQQSADLFYSIKRKESMDLFLMASELINAGKYEEIEKILRYAIFEKGKYDRGIYTGSVKEVEITTLEKAIVYTLLDITNRKYGLRSFGQNVLEALEKEINGEYPLPLPNIYPDAVCS
ncbi:MAG: hypothetical protein PVH46_04710, partial [Granulosicoccaceae bacterium]